MPVQLASWTCSANALAWVERAIAVNTSATGMTGVAEIGYPENINETYGLMDGSGSRLAQVLENYEKYYAATTWVSFDQAYAIARQTTGCLGGSSWYHWVAVRGIDGPNIWIANSAPGYKGIYDTLSRQEFNSLGPFSMVYLYL